MKYTIKGYTGPYPDFTDTIEIPDSFKLADFDSDFYFVGFAAYRALKPLLSKTAMPTDYLEVYDDGVSLASDLAEHDGQIVLLAEAYGCEHCQDQGHNEYTNGCEDDAPHGVFTLALEPVVGAL